eukprot:3015664-Pyramimonas_sp.AAC.1
MSRRGECCRERLWEAFEGCRPYYESGDGTARGLIAARSVQCDLQWLARVLTQGPMWGSWDDRSPSDGVARKRSEETF